MLCILSIIPFILKIMLVCSRLLIKLCWHNVCLLSIYHRQYSHQSYLNYNMQVSFTSFQLRADLLHLSDPLHWFWQSVLASQHVVLFGAEISLLLLLTPLLSDGILNPVHPTYSPNEYRLIVHKMFGHCMDQLSITVVQ